MFENHRQHKRIAKHLTTQFCLAEAFPKKWDMSILENISGGGVKFTASSDLDLSGKTIYMQIRVPELSPSVLQLQAVVLSAIPRLNGRILDIRAKFINLSEKDKQSLTIIENSINWVGIKNAHKAEGRII